MSKTISLELRAKTPSSSRMGYRTTVVTMTGLPEIVDDVVELIQRYQKTKGLEEI